MRYAPVILVASIFGLAVSFAPIFNMGIFLKPLVHQFGWTRMQVSGAAAAATLALALAAPFVGRIIDRIGPRRLIMVSSAAFATAIALLGTLTSSYPQFLLLAAFVGATGAGTTPLAYLALVAGWFDRRLGLALGISMTGIGVGVALSPLIATYFLETFGLRGAFIGMASLAALAIPNAIFILRDGEAAPPYGETAATNGAITRSMFPGILRSLNFWCIAGSVFLMTLVAGGCAIHLIALLTDRGYRPGEAAAVTSAIGLALLAGRFLTGILLDYVPVSVVAATTFLLGAMGVTLLATGAGPGFVVVLAACLVGFAQGAEGDVMAFAVRRCFGLEAYGLTYGLVFAAFNLGAFGGPLLLGFSYDRFDTYQPGLQMFIGFALVAAILACFIRPRSVEQHRAAATA